MARYIKANPKVVRYLNLENDRNQLKDGNYLLWQADILSFGRISEFPHILEQIGGIALQAHEARQEQDGTTVRELPTATDSRFVVEKYAEEQPEESPVTDGTETTETEEQTEEETEPAETDETPSTEDEQPEAVAEAEPEEKEIETNEKEIETNEKEKEA